MSSSEFQGQSLWAKLKSILIPPDTNLRESLEDVLEEEAGNDESLTGEELHMLRNLLGFKDVRVEDVMVPRAEITAVDQKTSLEDDSTGGVKKPFTKGALARADNTVSEGLLLS